MRLHLFSFYVLYVWYTYICVCVCACVFGFLDGWQVGRTLNVCLMSANVLRYVPRRLFARLHGSTLQGVCMYVYTVIHLFWYIFENELVVIFW